MTENVFGIHTSPSDFPRSHIDRLLANSQVVKFFHMWNDSNTIIQWKQKAPHAWFLGRDPRDIEGGELHNNYSKLLQSGSEDQAYNSGVDWAVTLSQAVIAHGLQFAYWEGTPNEHTYTDTMLDSKIAASFALGFVHGFLARGCKPAVGSWAYGQPKTPPWDGVNEWAPWVPVFKAIDAANRDSNGVALAEPRAIYQLHEYAKFKSMKASRKFAIERFDEVWERNVRPYNLWVPVIISEWGYAHDGPDDGRPGEADMLAQFVAEFARLAQIRELMGVALYDWRKVTSGTPDDYMSVATRLLDTLEAQNYTQRVLVPPGGIIPVPPDPPTGDKETAYNLRLRTGPGTQHQIITVMPKGTQVSIVDVDGDWVKVETAIEGWVLPYKQEYDSYSTWQKQSVDVTGWCSSKYLK